ncbi:MAG TPA: tetraacyldisaccharide 4'-kinase [Nitrospirota bacterium]
MLEPASWAYAAVGLVRARLYKWGVLKTFKAPCKVISVGNITAGGTGKTPFVIYLARFLKDAGVRVAVLTRGYDGTLEGSVSVVSDGSATKLSPSESGDEAALMALSLPGVPVIMGSRRVDAAKLAVERFGTEVVVLDDGFQHMALARDLNILLADAARPFGNGYVMPTGYLREPKSAARRADAVVLTRAPRDCRCPGEAEVLKAVPGVPVFPATHAVGRLYRLDNRMDAGMETLKNRASVAVSGLADPSSFKLILEGLGAKITSSMAYSDHHAYTAGDAVEIDARADESGADIIITTEKDAVKLAGFKFRHEAFVLGIEMEVLKSRDALEALVIDRIKSD